MVERDLRIVHPALAARRGIEGDDAVERRTEHEAAIDEDGRRLRRTVGDELRAASLDLAG